jgi:predicted amidophosphoribosyltransferase
MAFKRALWSSGYTYRMRCPYCGTNVSYTDKNLDFRPWYPNGFVYCPRCRKPLRHEEIYAVDVNGTPVYKTQEEANQALYIGYTHAMGYPENQGSFDGAGQAQTTDTVKFCPQCGRPYRLGKDHFCSGCGEKLD